MKRNVSLEEISDGKLYGSSDMVKAGCGGCRGCSACCHGMGSSIVLDPCDVWRLTGGLGKSVAELLNDGFLELNVVDGLILPNLRMRQDTEGCGFLTQEGRCSIHAIRPGICRLFPLGRYYPETDGQNVQTDKEKVTDTDKAGGMTRESDTDGKGRENRDGSFRYFLQVHECPAPVKTKVKISKWLELPNLARYESYISSWHTFLEQTEARLKEMDEEQIHNTNLFVLKLFFMKAYESTDFYPQFEARLAMARDVLEL